jgi:hypothetical protein
VKVRRGAFAALRFSFLCTQPLQLDLIMRLLKRKDFVGSENKKRRFETIPCPWDSNTGIRLRNLTAGEHAEFEMSQLTKKGGLATQRLIEAKRRLLALTIVDEQGNPEMSDADIAEMEDTDGGLVNWAYSEACKHCRITESEIEDLAKNSVAIGSGDSASDSPKS